VVRRLGTFSSADGVSQLLLRLTVTSTVYCLSELSSPWQGLQTPVRDVAGAYRWVSGSAENLGADLETTPAGSRQDPAGGSGSRRP